MNQQPTPALPDQIGLTTRIVVGALMAGLLSFSIVAFIVGENKGGQPGIISYIGVGFFVLMILVSLVMSKLSVSQSIKLIAAEQPEDWRTQLAPVFSSKVIMSNAPLEGSGFFNCIAYIIDGHWMSLAIVFAILAMMAMTFPSQSQFESWAEQVQREHS